VVAAKTNRFLSSLTTLKLVAVSIGGATVLKVGDNFASGASQNFLLTPTFWPVGGQKIA